MPPPNSQAAGRLEPLRFSCLVDALAAEWAGGGDNVAERHLRTTRCLRFVQPLSGLLAAKAPGDGPPQAAVRLLLSTALEIVVASRGDLFAQARAREWAGAVAEK